MVDRKGLAGWMMAGQTASGAIGGYQQLSSYRHQLRIQGIQDNINNMLAESAYKNRMEQLFTAQNEMKAQATQEMLEEQKAFRAKQAELRVFQAEKGMEGQSAVDTHNQLSASHHAWRQIQLANIQKAERGFQYQREGLIDQRTAMEAGQAMQSQESLSPWMGMFAGGFAGFQEGLASYYKMLDWAETDLGGK